MSERDIVDVLRAISGEHGDQLGFAECQEAADEITRLRAEVGRLMSVASPARGRVRCGAEACAVPALTDHDGAPAATAKAGEGTGNTPSLAAGARAENRDGGSGDRQPPHSSPASAAVTDDRPAPTAATLTRQERETLQAVRDIYESHDDDDECARIAAVVDALLARLGGGA